MNSHWFGSSGSAEIEKNYDQYGQLRSLQSDAARACTKSYFDKVCVPLSILFSHCFFLLNLAFGWSTVCHCLDDLDFVFFYVSERWFFTSFHDSRPSPPGRIRPLFPLCLLLFFSSWLTVMFYCTSTSRDSPSRWIFLRSNKLNLYPKKFLKCATPIL